MGTDGIKPTDVGIGTAIRKDSSRFPAIVVFPQTRPRTGWTNAMLDVALAALENVSNEFNGDNERTYLTGLSMGGRGAWLLAAREPGRFAAAVIIAGPVSSTTGPGPREELLRENPFMLGTDAYEGPKGDKSSSRTRRPHLLPNCHILLSQAKDSSKRE